MIVTLPITCKQGSWLIRYVNIPLMILSVYLMNLHGPVAWTSLLLIATWSIGCSSWMIYLVEKDWTLPEFSIKCKCEKNE